MITLDAIKDKPTRDAIRKIAGSLRLVQRKEGQTTVNLIGTGVPGGVRIGLPAARGNPLVHAPEVFIEVDIPNSFCGVYVTVPTDTAGVDWTWLYINGVTMT